MSVNGEGVYENASLNNEDMLNFDLIDLDDDEYQIPVLENCPTLENILNDDQCSLLSEDELSNHLSVKTAGNAGDVSDTSMESSTVNVSLLAQSRPMLLDSEYPDHPVTFKKVPKCGAILKHVVLKAISAQLCSACEKVQAGRPTVMSVTTMVAVGTAHGYIMLFDAAQTLKWFHEGDKDQGSVSSLALNVDCTRLLAGFAKGLILMLDTADGTVLRKMADVHTPFTGVLHVKFTDNPTMAVCSDSGGSVFQLNFKRVLGLRSCDSRCIFSGSQGEVLCLEPLLLHQFLSHPLQGATIVAMATLTKIIVVSLSRELKSLFTHGVTAPVTTLPLLAWQFVVIQAPIGSSRSMDPVLAFARDSTVHFFQVKVESSGRLACVYLQQMNVDFSMISCNWLNSRTLALMDTSEKLHLMDVRTREELELVDLSSVNLVYSSSHFKGLATGGNVSKAMAVAGKRACYNSVKSFGNQMLLLGMDSIHVISIQTWNERIDHLKNAKLFVEALLLSMDFYNERGKGVIGLRGPRKTRMRVVKEKIIEVMTEFIENIIDGSVTYEALPMLIDYIIAFNQSKVLFDKLWQGIRENKSTEAFLLNTIGNAILKKKTKWLPPELMQRLLQHVNRPKDYSALERILMTVDLSCVDIQLALKLCKENNLQDGLISIWNRGMQDYATPIVELIPILQDQLNKGMRYKQECTDLGNRLLLYLTYCLTGRTYPDGNDAKDLEDMMKQQVFKMLFSQHSMNANESEVCYPYIRTFLHFNTQEFLKTFSHVYCDQFTSNQILQRFINIFIQIMIDNPGFSAVEVGRLLVFFKYILNPNKNSYAEHLKSTLRIDKKYFDLVLNLLVNCDDVSSLEERENIFIELISDNVMSNYTNEECLELARKAQFYHGCRVLYQYSGEFCLQFKYFLLDHRIEEKKKIFSFIVSVPQKDMLNTVVLENISYLVDINGWEAGVVVYKYFQNLISDMIPKLNENQLYPFLKGMVSQGLNDPRLLNKYFELLCIDHRGNALSFVEDHHNNLDLEHVMLVAMENNLFNVISKVHELNGDYQKAFDVLLTELQKKTNEMDVEVELIAMDIICLIRRLGNILDPKKTWVPLMKRLMQLKAYPLMKLVLDSKDLSWASELNVIMENSDGTLGDLRSLILGLFDKMKKERQSLLDETELSRRKRAAQFISDIREVSKGYRLPPYCSLCKCTAQRKQREDSTIIVFRCAHRFHKECLKRNDDRYECVVCKEQDGKIIEPMSPP